ncbi:MAG: serine phosphatase RsbU (regulator of sigma subunit) [bacterium]|jgi:serine phosphatase RsbU (regulator of sigma subunit)
MWHLQCGFEKMNIFHKTRMSRYLSFSLISLGIILSYVLFIWINYQSSWNSLQETVVVRGKRFKSAFELSMQSTMSTMQQVASYIAQDKKVQSLFMDAKKAIAKGEQGIKHVDEIRDQLLNQVEQGWLQMHQKYYLQQLHFHMGPKDTSFLRVHRPDKYGDDLALIRHTIMDVNTHKITVKGFEVSKTGTGIIGAVPIFFQDPKTGKQIHIGALEAGTSFTSLLLDLKKALKADFAILLSKKHLEKTVFPDHLNRVFAWKPPIKNFFMEVTTSSQIYQLLQQKKIQSVLKSSGNRLIKLKQIPLGITSFLLRDYEGIKNPSKPAIATILMWSDISRETKALEQKLKINILISIVGFIFIEIMLFWGFRFATRFLQRKIDKKTLELRESNHQLTKVNHELIEGLEQARITQSCLLPQEFPDLPGVRIATKYIPMEHIGGDFYDFVMFNKEQFGVIIVDVTGHGAQAALIASMFSSLFKTYATQQNSLSSTFSMINDALYKQIPDDKYATAFYCTFNSETHELTYTAAGHPPGYIIRMGENEIIPLEMSGLMLGSFSGEIASYDEVTEQLNKGDKIFLYTDGIIEMTDFEDQMFGEERLQQWLLANSHLSVSELLDQVYSHILQYSGKSKFNDDITLVGLEIGG